MKELQQHINVLHGLLDLVIRDAETLQDYKTTNKDSNETRKVVQERFYERTTETLSRIDITVERIKYHAKAIAPAPQ